MRKLKKWVVYVLLIAVIMNCFSSCGNKVYTENDINEEVKATALLGEVEFEIPQKIYDDSMTLSKDTDYSYILKNDKNYINFIYKIENNKDSLANVDSYKDLKEKIYGYGLGIQLNQDKDIFLISDENALKVLSSVHFAIDEICTDKYYGYVSIIEDKSNLYLMLVGYIDKTDNNDKNALRVAQSFSCKKN